MKDDVLQFRLSAEDKLKIKEMAKKSGLTLTDFIIMKCNDERNDNDDNNYALSALSNGLKDRDIRISHLEARLKGLKIENLELRNEVKKPQLIEVGAFDKDSVNGRPSINVFVDWIGYSMFVKDLKFEAMENEKQQLYREVWNNHIKPMYKEFCNRHN